MRFLYLVVIGLCACAHSPAPEPASPAVWRGRPSARISGDRVTLAPSGESFRVPPAWLDWHRKFRNNLHLTRAQLDRVRDATGEWDREYAAVVNAALPFDSCAAHIGGEGWGRDAVAFADLQMRVYVGAFEPRAVRAAVVTSGRAAAEGFFRPVTADSAVVGSWESTTLRWGAFYYDYGGTAHVDVLVSRRGQRSVVVVFMYAWPSARQREGDAVLASFTSPG